MHGTRRSAAETETGVRTSRVEPRGNKVTTTRISSCAWFVELEHEYIRHGGYSRVKQFSFPWIARGNDIESGRKKAAAGRAGGICKTKESGAEMKL